MQVGVNKTGDFRSISRYMSENRIGYQMGLVTVEDLYRPTYYRITLPLTLSDFEVHI